MRFKLSDRRVMFEYGALNAPKLTPLDIKQRYRYLGGKIEPETEIEFSSYFPGSYYERTALTSKMPPEYLCVGSISCIIHQPNSRDDVLSISAYRDKSRHAPTIGDHHNLFLQYQIADEINHTNEIPNRHIPLSEGVLIKAVVDDEEVLRQIIK
ncbi:MAG: hypothetical protein ACTSR3_23090 [Candidatus Helarchaeota archaeon]